MVRNFFLNLRERPFEAIKNGTKKVEVKANKKKFTKNSVNLMKTGDVMHEMVLKHSKIFDFWCPGNAQKSLISGAQKIRDFLVSKISMTAKFSLWIQHRLGILKIRLSKQVSRSNSTL